MRSFILYTFSFAAIFTLMLSSSCQDDDSNILPAATEEGKNTFGCLVNGEAWTPAGKPQDLILDLSYDPSFDGGTLDLFANRFLDNNDNQFMYIFSTGVGGVGTYSLNSVEEGAATFNYSIECNYDRANSVYREGSLSVTKLNLETQIISGTFEFILAKPNCDTIRVTQGRFDMKI